MLRPEYHSHAVVIPLYGELTPDLVDYLLELENHDFLTVLVDNNFENTGAPAKRLKPIQVVVNRNRGGVAGGFNRGIDWAQRAGASWITLLDQDSRIPIDQICRLKEPWEAYPQRRMVVGPSIWDAQRQVHHGRRQRSQQVFQQIRLLISSGTTFRSSDWHDLGVLHEGLCIDFVDHAWCFRAQVRGFEFVQHAEIMLKQQFGALHPNGLCRWMGLQLYSPKRHFYGLRNLRWLCLQPYVPPDLRFKELLKMLVKPWLWLLFEPQRWENCNAIWAGLVAPLPGKY